MIVIMGSHREGNCNFIGDLIRQKVKDAIVLDLKKIDIKLCNGCLVCFSP